MATKVHGFVLRSQDRVRLQQFYSALGLNFIEHQHGGPVHLECKDVDSSLVLEIYAASTRFSRDAIMLIVDSLVGSMEAAVASGGQVLQPVKDQGTIRFAYVADPDGRPIMLVESLQ